MKRKRIIKKEKINLNDQLKIIDRATGIAIKKLEKERKAKSPRNYFVEWFRYIELTSEQLQKYLN